MRLVPLFAAVGLLSTPAFGDLFTVSAGKSSAAVKLQNEGEAYMERGEYAKACKDFDEAIRLDPTMWPAYYNRAAVESRQNKLEQALRDATMALRGRTSFTQSAILRAHINLKLGRYDAALRELNQVASLGSRGNAFPYALNGLAWFYATCPEPRYRNARLAITQALKACSLTNYKSADCLDTLAAGYAEAGDFENAVHFEEKALAIAETPVGMRAQQEHMASFKKHRPWRETATN